MSPSQLFNVEAFSKVYGSDNNLLMGDVMYLSSNGWVGNLNSGDDAGPSMTVTAAGLETVRKSRQSREQRIAEETPGQFEANRINKRMMWVSIGSAIIAALSALISVAAAMKR